MINEGIYYNLPLVILFLSTAALSPAKFHKVLFPTKEKYLLSETAGGTNTLRAQSEL